jgi:hypothetical protein
MPLERYDETTSGFITALVAAEPALAAVLDEHLATYEELLPHVFMGDVTRWLTAHDPPPRVLGILDEAVASESADVRGLVYMSFLEHLEAREALHQRLVASLPPRLRAALTGVGGDRA